MRIAKRKNLLTYSKVLFAISIALVIYGLVLDYITEHGLIDPVNDVEIVTPSNTINITTKDDIINNPNNSNDNNDNNDNNGYVNNNPISNNENIQGNVNDDSVDIVNEQVNKNLRDKIEKKYSIKVLYADETEGYKVSDLSTVKLTDVNTIYNQLNSLNNALSKYPNGLFKEIKKGGIPLTIILIKNYSDTSVTGITDSNYDYANISIASIYPFEESFYHESYHYIERYMFKKGASFTSWDLLNPDGFNWGTIDATLAYNMTGNSSSAFVNNYAMTSAPEDRASTFEYMMTANEPSCFQNRNNTIWLKANYMAMTMESALDSVSPNDVEYWERWIKND